MRKWIITVLIIFLWTGMAFGRHVSSKKIRTSGKTKNKAVVTAIKEDPYKAYLVMDARTGKIIEGENINLKRAPASVVKLMLAYIVLEKLAAGEIRLTDTITVSRESSKIGGSQVYLKEGETFTLEEMMKAILVASANDAAYAVAEYVSGTRDAFLQLMNKKARDLNMADTEFNSINGLPPSKGGKEDASSCKDLAVLARELLKYPKILEWTSIKSEGFRDGTFIMNNHNKLLYRMPEVDGLKTGYYYQTGFNIVATAMKNDLRLIVVVLGSSRAKTRDNIALEKFKNTFPRYTLMDIVKKGEIIDREVFLADGETDRIKGVAGASLSYSVPIDKKGTILTELVVPEKIKGEIKKGQKLGDLVIKVDNEIIGKIDIIAPVSVPKASIFKKFISKIS